MLRSDSSSTTSALVIAIFALTGLVVVSQLYLPLPIMQPLNDDYGASGWPVSWVLSAFGFAYAAGFLVFGPLSDRLGRRRVLLYGMLSLIAATLLVTLARDGKELIIARALQGFCAASFPPVALAYLGEALPAQRRMTAIAWMSFAFLSAAVLAQIFILTLADSDLRTAETLAAGIYLVALGALLLTIRTNTRATVAPQSGMFDGLSRLPPLILSRTLCPYYLAAFTLLLAFVCFYSLIASDSTATLANLGLSPQLFRSVALPGIAATFLAPRLAQRYGVHRVLLASFTLMASGLLYSSLSLSDSTSAGLILGNILLAGGVALAAPLLIVAVSSKAPKADRGSAVALYTFVLFCGASGAPFLSSTLESYGLQSALLLLCGLPSLAILILTAWPRLAGHRQPTDIPRA
ncbi:MAG: YNFM family putative membrane transporter [Motiliproteus sp.]|jgi:YNFM family putative membrane transporter